MTNFKVPIRSTVRKISQIYFNTLRVSALSKFIRRRIFRYYR